MTFLGPCLVVVVIVYGPAHKVVPQDERCRFRRPGHTEVELSQVGHHFLVRLSRGCHRNTSQGELRQMFPFPGRDVFSCEMFPFVEVSQALGQRQNRQFTSYVGG